MAHQLFFDICEKKPTEIDLFFSDKTNFPRIEYEPRMTVYFPLPREVQGIQILQGNTFLNLETSQETIFSLFFAAICHAAGHAKVTDFKKYKDWMEGKNKKRAYETLEFIEDIRVNEFLRNEFPEYYSEIRKITEFFNTINEKKEFEDFKKHSKKIFSETFVKDIKKNRVALKKEIMTLDSEDKEKFTQIADIIYESSNILTDQKVPFEDHFSYPKRIEKWNENISINTEGRFQSIVNRFSDMWFGQLKLRARVRKKYGKISEDLEFDKIDFAPENIGEYLRLKNATHVFLKKMSSQIKLTPNVQDEGSPENVGVLQLQYAIQAVAAKNPNIQIFEQDDYRRIEEEWAIIVDTSSSMKLRFDEMKKFAICLGEAADEVNSKSGKWGFFTFNNNFSIVKDHFEKFDQNARARIGGIEINGLSFIADAITLCTRLLDKDDIERKYIFLITDGQALGIVDGDKKMEEAIKLARKKGISVVAIGIQDGSSRIYSMCMPYEGMKRTVAKFLRAYTILAEGTA